MAPWAVCAVFAAAVLGCQSERADFGADAAAGTPASVPDAAAAAAAALVNHLVAAASAVRVPRKEEAERFMGSGVLQGADDLGDRPALLSPLDEVCEFGDAADDWVGRVVLPGVEQGAQTDGLQQWKIGDDERRDRSRRREVAFGRYGVNVPCRADGLRMLGTVLSGPPL